MIAFSSIAPAFTFSSQSFDSTEAAPDTSAQNSAISFALPQFDGQNAYSHVEKQVKFGSRVPNSTPHWECKGYLLDEMRKHADVVVEQSFVQVIYDLPWSLTNIIAQFQPEKTERVLLCAHWDSRPYSDEDSNAANYHKGIPGANDGGSGVSVLLELARILGESKPNIGVDVVFFDGEDIGLGGDADQFCIGSKFFAQHFPFAQKPRYAVVLDMVGDSRAEFYVEQSSYQAAPRLVKQIWGLGVLYAPQYFRKTLGTSVLDDHIALIALDIPTVNIIDMELIGNTSMNPNRRYWHTQSDDMRNIDPQTLRAVGMVLIHLLYAMPLAY